MSETKKTELNLAMPFLQITLFEDKLIQNFTIINERLKQLQLLTVLEERIKANEKQIKFTAQKLDSAIERIPRQTMTRSDTKLIATDTFFQLFEANDEKIQSSPIFKKIKDELSSLKFNQKNSENSIGIIGRHDNSTQQIAKTTFTAAKAMNNQRGQDNKINKQALLGVLDANELDIVSNIINPTPEGDIFESFSLRIQDLYQKIQEIQEKQSLERAHKYSKYQQKMLDKSATQKKIDKEKSIRLQGIKKDQVKGEILKGDLYSEHHKAEILKQQLMSKQQPDTSRKSLLQIRDEKTIKIEDGIETDLRSHKKIKSLAKIDRQQRKLKVDDLKDINSVFRDVQARIDAKVSHDLFIGFVNDMEEKIEILRVTKDFTNDISEIRKTIYAIDSRVQAIANYLQSVSNEDDALLVKKQWTCASCDKSVDKFIGKIGQHLNWDGMNAKKMSPLKAGAYGQTGQLATKIKNLMDANKPIQ